MEIVCDLYGKIRSLIKAIKIENETKIACMKCYEKVEKETKKRKEVK